MKRPAPAAARRLAGLVHRSRWLCCLALCAGCAGPSAASAGPAATAPSRATSPPGFGTSSRLIEAKGQGLEFPLPDAPGWRLDQREKHSWVALHRQSSSRLVVRAWHFDGIPRADDCERQARLWRKDLPRLAPAEIISENERQLAGSYRGRVTVAVRAVGAPQPERLFGDVLGFGSDARDCLMLAFTTSASGPGAREIIAERLATIAGTVFERARRLQIEERVSVPRL